MQAKAVEQTLQKLQPADRFRILSFNDNVTELSGSWQNYNEGNSEPLMEQLRETGAKGGTDFLNAMRSSFSMLDQLRSSAIVLVSDGEANIGTIEKKAFLLLMKRFDIRLFTVVVGDNDSQPLLKTMTERSNGKAIQISNASKLADALAEFLTMFTHRALYDIKVELKEDTSGSGIAGATIEDSSSYWPSSLYKGQQFILSGHYHGSGPVEVKVRGNIAGQQQQYLRTFSLPLVTHNNARPIKDIVAYHKLVGMQDIADYMGDDSEYRDAISDLLQSHSLTIGHSKKSPQPTNSIESAQSGNRLTSTASEPTTADNPVAGGGVAGYLLLLVLPVLGFARRKYSRPHKPLSPLCNNHN